MPIEVPNLDNRKYQELLADALSRIPVHNPEWTNFNKSDPGVTLIEVFAFVAESLLYRCNQIPERNRKKFLSILGVQLQPASSARGLVTFNNERGPLETFTLNADLEVSAGQVPFRTEAGLDVLPIEGRAYYKRKREDDSPELTEYYKSLYVSFQGSTSTPSDFQLYETTPLTGSSGTFVDLASETVDGALWIALLVREADKPYDQTIVQARRAIAEKTMTLALVPGADSDEIGRVLAPGGPGASGQTSLLNIEMPLIPASGGLPEDRQPAYRSLLKSRVPSEPSVLEISLPGESELKLWNNLDPLEDGADQMPPAFEDAVPSERIITWIKVSWPKGAGSKLLWAGINTVFVTQRSRVLGEILPEGTGTPDQRIRLANKPVIPGSVRLSVNGSVEPWKEVDDLMAAGPEVPIPDLRLPPGLDHSGQAQLPSEVFVLNAEAGELVFGDGFRGKRPPSGAALRVDYEFGLGAGGNVSAGAISRAAALPSGVKVLNHLRTWSGANSETADDGEKQISKYLRHRERLVTAEDFEDVVLRTPGAEVARVEIIPAYTPALADSEPGDAPGAVTIMVIPRNDPVRPETPSPDTIFLNTICDYIDPRRLVTTEIYLRGPTYVPVWVSVGINIVAGKNAGPVREAVEHEVERYLSPLRLPEELDDQSFANLPKGWPLRKSVSDIELISVVSRVPGVASVNGVFIAAGASAATNTIPTKGLELPRLEGISVVTGQPVSLDEIRGLTSTTPTTSTKIVPVPAIPEEC